MPTTNCMVISTTCITYITDRTWHIKLLGKTVTLSHKVSEWMRHLTSSEYQWFLTAASTEFYELPFYTASADTFLNKFISLQLGYTNAFVDVFFFLILHPELPYLILKGQNYQNSVTQIRTQMHLLWKNTYIIIQYTVTIGNVLVYFPSSQSNFQSKFKDIQINTM